MLNNNVVLFDLPSTWQNLLPLTYTRPVCAIRVGILTIEEKWQKVLDTEVSFLTQDYLSKKFLFKNEELNLYINGGYCPSSNLLTQIASLKNGEAIYNGDELVAALSNDLNFDSNNYQRIEVKEVGLSIANPWDVFKLNGEAIKQDFELLTKGRIGQVLSPTNTLVGNKEDVFIEEGAIVEAATLSTKNGPIYIGKDAEVMEGAVVRGPFALCNNGVVKMTAKIYGPTTIGPHSKVGGEVNNSVLLGYSNKGHDGFLGNSVIGEWCNLGADTNNSNLKNNYANVRLWNYGAERFVDTGLQFCGLVMGDHSKCGINTMFNTGTVVGVSANIYGAGFPRNFVSSFSWGGASGFTEYKLNKVFEVAEIVMQRRGIELTDNDKEILEHIFETTAKYRNK